ncbi:D-2-hydroxyacid dehydrogenase, partial [Klebsiella pneumoniae]
MNILSTTNMSEKHQQRLSKQFPQHRFIYAANPEEGRSALTEADVLVAFGNGIGEETLDEAPRLKWIHVMSAGLETLPFPKLQDRGILLTNVRGIHAIPMA